MDVNKLEPNTSTPTPKQNQMYHSMAHAKQSDLTKQLKHKTNPMELLTKQLKHKTYTKEHAKQSSLSKFLENERAKVKEYTLVTDNPLVLTEPNEPKSFRMPLQMKQKKIPDKSKPKKQSKSPKKRSKSPKKRRKVKEATEYLNPIDKIIKKAQRKSTLFHNQMHEFIENDRKRVKKIQMLKAPGIEEDVRWVQKLLRSHNAWGEEISDLVRQELNDTQEVWTNEKEFNMETLSKNQLNEINTERARTDADVDRTRDNLDSNEDQDEDFEIIEEDEEYETMTKANGAKNKNLKIF
ncbi:hypothetical protein WDU94_005773 [Cyamophila willieti]